MRISQITNYSCTNFKGVDIKLAPKNINAPIKVLFSDIDGTILDNGKLSDEHLNSIKKLIDSGVKLILTTGRGYKTIDDLFSRFKMKPDYAITECGAAIVDKDKNKLYENCLSAQNVEKIINISKQIIGKNKFFRLTFDGLPYAEDIAALEADKIGRIGYVKSFREFLDKGIMPSKAVFANYDSESFTEIDTLVNEVKRLLAPSPDLNIINTGYHYCEIMNSDVSKGNALNILRKILGYEYENVANIGDAENDISMSEVLTPNNGMSISMANGTDKMREVSRFITSSVDNFGFAKAVDTIIEINKRFEQNSLQRTT